MIPVTPRTIEHLTRWCAIYQAGGTVPHPRHVRFSIGIYQISQGLAWPSDCPARWQSFCAAAMHFLCCASAYGIHLSTAFPETLEEIEGEPPSSERMLVLIGQAQQQVFYSLNEIQASTRASRFKLSILQERLFALVRGCFQAVPPAYREIGCMDEMGILCRDLPKAVAAEGKGVGP